MFPIVLFIWPKLHVQSRWHYSNIVDSCISCLLLSDHIGFPPHFHFWIHAVMNPFRRWPLFILNTVWRSEQDQSWLKPCPNPSKHLRLKPVFFNVTRLCCVLPAPTAFSLVCEHLAKKAIVRKKKMVVLWWLLSNQLFILWWLARVVCFCANIHSVA